MTDTLTQAPRSVPRALWLALALNFVWINASEVFRYFAFVMPMMRDALPMVDNVAPMSWPVFFIWGAWDTALVLSATLIPWLFFERFGTSLRWALLSGTFMWMTVFVILWVGLYNMNLGAPAILAVALPLAWVEMVVAALITRWTLLRENPARSSLG